MCASKSSAKKKVLYSDEFYSDMSLPEMIHAVLIRSPFSFGKISSIGLGQNEKLPDGYYLFTSKDLPKNSVKIMGSEIPVLCDENIDFKGQPVAILAGADKGTLEELKKNIQIQLDDSTIAKEESQFLKSYKNLSVSLFDGSPVERKITPVKTSSEIVARRKLSVGDCDGVFSDTESQNFVIEGSWTCGLHYDANKECAGALCLLKGSYLHIFAPSHWISQMKQTVSEVTGLPKEKIIVTRTRLSVKTTNMIWQNGIFAAMAAFVAVKTGRPVSLSLSREEESELIEQPPEVRIFHKTSIDRTGNIQAMDVSLDFDAGAYNPLTQDILDRLAISSTGIYGCKNVRISAKAYKTRTPPSSVHLSMIDSYAFFAIENQIQKIAEITGFSPVELRLLNKIDIGKKKILPFSHGFGRATDAINAIALRSDFRRKYTVSRLAERGRYEMEDQSPYSPPLRGIGLASCFEGSGYPGSYFSASNISLQVSVSEDKKIIVHAYPTSSAIREIWTKIIMDSLGTEKRNISFTNETIEEIEGGTNEDSSQILPEPLVGTVSIKTILLKKCIESIKRKKIEDAPFSVKKTLSSTKKTSWNQKNFSGSPYYNTAFGTCTVELELDPCTFRENFLKICVIIDGGKILSPKTAESAVYRSIQRCLKVLVDDDIVKCPAVSVQFMQSEEEPKQIGHLIYSMLPSAFASALAQALAFPVTKLPLQTDSIYKIMEDKDSLSRLQTEVKK